MSQGGTAGNSHSTGLPIGGTQTGASPLAGQPNQTTAIPAPMTAPTGGPETPYSPQRQRPENVGMTPFNLQQQDIQQMLQQYRSGQGMQGGKGGMAGRVGNASSPANFMGVSQSPMQGGLASIPQTDQSSINSLQ